MAIKLPRLTWSLDCEVIGYPGLVIEFWLNPPSLSDEESAKLSKASLYESLARVVERVIVPAVYTVSGEPEIIDGTATELRALDRSAGFDPQVLVWASGQYREQRGARLGLELKN